MKNKIVYFIFVITLLWMSCDPAVVFTTPQPEGVKISDAFAPEFRGKYLCESDSSIVVVDSHIVYKRHWYDFTIREDQIKNNSNLIQIGDSLFVKDVGKCAQYRIENDTVFASVPLTDTLFWLDGIDMVLKSYQGHQILSLKMKEDKYEVVVLSLDENFDLQLKLATFPGELENLEVITPVKDISTDEVEQYLIQPTRMEFDEILRQEIVFEACEFFKRVEVPNFEIYVF